MMGSPKRTGVFIDGQNVTIGAGYAFGGGPHAGAMHPLLLARELLGDGERLVEVRYVTGIPDPEVDPQRNEAERRRHDLMAATDVIVLERPLRYRWEWSIRDRDLGDPRDHKGDVTQARVKSRNVGQEKGIDVWLGLDALAMCARADLEKVIIVTADADLDLVPRYLRTFPAQEGTEVFQAKVLGDGKKLWTNSADDHTIAIDRSVYERARDDFDYRDPLPEDDVAAFVARFGVETDGFRDPGSGEVTT